MAESQLLGQLTNALGAKDQKQIESTFNELLEKNFPLENSKMGYPPLHKSCWMGNSEMTKKLLLLGVDPNGRNSYSKSALHYAGEYNQVQCATLLLEHGANVDQLDKYGRSPLFIAAEFSGNDVGLLLLAHGADPHRKNEDGKTPASHAKNSLKDAIESYSSLKPAKRDS